jgi:predicted permease
MGGGPLILDLAPDRNILAFSAAVAIATAVLFGLAPAIHTTAAEPAAGLKHNRRVGSARSRLLPSLVAAQIALSLILLVGAGLFIRTLHNLQAQDPGFSADGVLTVHLDPRAGGVPTAALTEVRAIPGVLSVSASTDLPLTGSIWSEPAVPAGQPLPEQDTAVFFGVSPEFFELLHIPLRAGRAFTTGDTVAAPSVAIVNERFAHRYFSGRNPVGSRLTVRHDQQAVEIVGVAENTRVYGLRDNPSPVVYVPYAQLPGQVRTTIEVRAAGSPNTLEAELRRILQPLSPRTPVEVQRLSESVDATLRRERMLAALGAGFGVLALVLAAVGIYGLLSYAVTQRTREIGIRMALGARRGGVVAVIVRGALTPLAAGIAIALPAAWLLSRKVESMLFGLRGTDPLTNVGAIVLLVLVALLAAFLPARRAARVNPVIALRNE